MADHRTPSPSDPDTEAATTPSPSPRHATRSASDGTEATTPHTATRDTATRDTATHDGAARDGAARDGAARDGAARDGAARDGAARDGAARDGAARDGAEHSPRGDSSLSDRVLIAAIPAQRTDSGEPVRRWPRDQRGRFVARRFSPLPDLPDLPDLVAAMATVPGGLGVELGACSGASFIYADIEWTPADAHAGGSPIGYRLATEQAHLLTMNNPTMNNPTMNEPAVSNPRREQPERERARRLVGARGHRGWAHFAMSPSTPAPAASGLGQWAAPRFPDSGGVSSIPIGTLGGFLSGIEEARPPFFIPGWWAGRAVGWWRCVRGWCRWR